jgi:hypothetical protein
MNFKYLRIFLQANLIVLKKSKAFGKAVGDTIYSEWFYNGSGTCRFYTNRAEFYERRLTNGKVNMEKYYHKLGTNGDVSLLNLSKKSLSTMPKIVDLVVNGMVNRHYSIKSTTLYHKIINLHIEKDRGRPKLYANNSKAKEDFGMDIEVCQWTKFLSQKKN